MSAPTSRPVHPCVISIFEGSTGAECSTWAHLTTKRSQVPNLVTAQASTLTVYTLDESSGKLLLTHVFRNLSGCICYLETLRTTANNQDVGEDTDTGAAATDSLLLGFCGHPRLIVVSLSTTTASLSSSPTLSMATSLIDLTQALVDHCFGSITPLEIDLSAATVQTKNVATVSVVLGGGVATAILTLRFNSRTGWLASEPYILPLVALQQSYSMGGRAGSSKAAGTSSFATSSSTNSNAVTTNSNSIATGFGDILSVTFLPGYIEPTILLLHSNPAHHGGRAWPGRLGRPHYKAGTRYGLVVSAISATVTHAQSAMLWSVEVPADAFNLVSFGTNGCLVVCCNSLVSVTNAGRIDSILAVNGWVRSTCPARLVQYLQPNPKPFPKLAIQLDGSALSFCSDTAAFLSLRCGQVYLLQRPAGSRTWSLMPLGSTIGSLGQVMSLVSCPFSDVRSGTFGSKITSDTKNGKGAAMSMGLLFACSRMGDSSLLGYALETASLHWENLDEGKRIKREEVQSDKNDTDLVKLEDTTTTKYVGILGVEPEYDAVLRMEEDALYTRTTKDDTAYQTEPDIIPPSSDEESVELPMSKRKLSCLINTVTVRALTVLDSIKCLGALGPACEGAISEPQRNELENRELLNPNAPPPIGPSTYVLPCGYGSSGGLAILTVPGRDNRSISVEEDCLNVQCVFSLPTCNLILLGMDGTTHSGIRSLRLQENTIKPEDEKEASGESSSTFDLAEIDHYAWCSSDSTRALFESAVLLSSAEFRDGIFAVVSSRVISVDTSSSSFLGIAILQQVADQVKLMAEFDFPCKQKHCDLLSMTPLIRHQTMNDGGDHDLLIFCCIWSSGDANLIAFNQSGIAYSIPFDGADAVCMEDEDSDSKDESDREQEQFYESSRIVSIDLFHAPSKFFTFQSEVAGISSNSGNPLPSDEKHIFDDDEELYGPITVDHSPGSHKNGVSVDVTPDSDEEDELFLAICRQSGRIEIFAVSSCNPKGQSNDFSPIWSANGGGHGVPILSNFEETEYRTPKFHQICVQEMRFFLCGPSLVESTSHTPSLSRRLCLAIETNRGDLFLYVAETANGVQHRLARFQRVPLGLVARPSQEQVRHHAKLRRKGIAKVSISGNGQCKLKHFRYNMLHSFQSISGQDGLFAGVSRPFWIVAQRGKPEIICHRSRHAAPAGGKPRPVPGFCSAVGGDGTFLTLHERVGRVGSQRLTVYRDISNIFNSEGLLPGGGLCVEKIALGVTVRRIQFIDDADPCSGLHPLYAVLVSREVQMDQSHLNDDGLTTEERDRLEQEKEAAKIKRQVEADLGGFDIEQEWVEEIERDDCFQIDTELGGAPPIPQSSYSLWIVDAANQWDVVDSHELGEFEHGMTMKVMWLTEIQEEPGSANASSFSNEEINNKLFITVGTGTVDADGEDVSSKGRVLLFEVKRLKRKASKKNASSPVAELSLVTEKQIFHGPVTSLSCLTSQGKNRLVIGAGADVNVEQWGNGKLTQVGFFRATMQILDILLFKNFFLLSDAYDSLYFLVWRESDKSLTLLAKDYDPIPVYAAGTMSRGGSLSFVCQDDRQNLQFFQYAPGEAAARGGNKLVCRADFHLGSITSALQSHQCRSSLWVNSATPSSTLAALKQQDTFFGRTDDDQRIGIHFGSSDGGLGAVIPLSEPIYWRLTALQSVMANALESNCALNPRAWRLYRRTYRRRGCRSNDRKKGVIDGELVIQYADLGLADQEDLASAIGSTVDLILDNLLEIKCASMVI